ncbi:MAG: hypothetical protein M1828_003140 [Chrysothrix sp. TS-e1954]|nr:MAG: hypothetical protein M1828_003140 [Chrysothrix sp. TS-e1954]
MANILTPVPSLKLNDGNSIPMLAYGTGTAWFKKSPTAKADESLISTIKTAISMGWRHLDGAETYNTEPELGTAIKDGGVPRSELFVTTKIWKGFDDIAGSLKTSLEKLQLDYVDLYLIHSPFKMEKDEELQSAWRQMEALKKQGLAKSIGVSNYLPRHLEATLKVATIPPAINQIEFHPYLQRAKLIEYHKQHHIATAAYGPLTPVTKGAPGPVDEYLEGVAKKYAVSPSEVLLRWYIDQDVVPVTTSGKEQRISDYLRATTFKLTPKEVGMIGQLGEKKHFRGFFTQVFDDNDRT